MRSLNTSAGSVVRRMWSRKRDCSVVRPLNTPVGSVGRALPERRSSCK